MGKKGFLAELWHRIISPWSWPFLGYLLIVTFFGGVGVFFTIYEIHNRSWVDAYKIAESVSIFFVAIIATSCIDLNLSATLSNRLSFLIYSFIFYGLAVFLLWLTYDLKSNYAFLPSLIGMLLSLIVWVIANADNEKLTEENFFNTMRGSNEGHGENWQ